MSLAVTIATFGEKLSLTWRDTLLKKFLLIRLLKDCVDFVSHGTLAVAVSL